MWNISSGQLLKKIENLQKRALCFLLKDYGSTYEYFLGKSGYPDSASFLHSAIKGGIDSSLSAHILHSPTNLDI